ncbi:MAG: hypothetical protein IPK83_16200 [Planctomycetes bacterium]|nr:hypothetical protein [Planctomycetota bacterium]
MPIDPQIAGWIRWLERKMNLKERFLSLLFTTGGKNDVGYFTVIARPLVSEDFLLITAQAGNLSYLDDLTAISPQDAPEWNATCFMGVVCGRGLIGRVVVIMECAPGSA